MNATQSHANDPAKEMLLRNTKDVLRAFMECSDEIQKGVLEMVQVLSDDSADVDAKAAAADTMIEALYPQYHEQELGMDSEKYDGLQRTFQPEIDAELDKEEVAFADNLARIMEERKMSQADLAKAIGVGQPAISMMLARNCRPQRRTIAKLAQALGVQLNDLWPEA